MLTVSIVSHGHGERIRDLLTDLEPLSPKDVTIVVTLNIPEPESFLDGHSVQVIRNVTPKGFGANHNQAFRLFPGRYFVVLNPDVRCDWRIFRSLVETVERSGVGACAPIVRSPEGSIEDSARMYPTPSRIIRRVLARSAGRVVPLDYPLAGTGLLDVEWIAGMFMLFPSEAFRHVGGFDERYHMYLEDADICYRLRRSGRSVSVARDSFIVHDAQRVTLKNFKHFRWHFVSLLRFLMRRFGGDVLSSNPHLADVTAEQRQDNKQRLEER